MKRGEIINGYKILEDFKVAGGQSKISFCEKNGKDYFIKEFLSPKFPIESSPGSATIKKRRKDKCVLFESHHNKINKLISEKSGLGGNLVFAIDFFRFGTTYYKINEKIDVSTISVDSIHELSLTDILLICKTLCHSLKILHQLDIIHGDIKPDNVLIKKTETSAYTTKLIDFDNSFFDSKPPLNIEDIVGDQVYYSPELANYILESSDVSEEMLTTKSDIYALGLLLHQYLTGHLPFKPSEEFNYAWQMSINKTSLNNISSRLPNVLKELVVSMLNVSYKERPTISYVFDTLKTISKDKSLRLLDDVSTVEKKVKVKLGGTLLSKKRKVDLSDPDIKDKKVITKLKGKLIKK